MLPVLPLVFCFRTLGWRGSSDSQAQGLDIVAGAHADIVDGFTTAGAGRTNRPAKALVDIAETAFNGLGANAFAGRAVRRQLTSRLDARQPWTAEPSASGAGMLDRVAAGDDRSAEPQDPRNE